MSLVIGSSEIRALRVGRRQVTKVELRGDVVWAALDPDGFSANMWTGGDQAGARATLRIDVAALPDANGGANPRIEVTFQAEAETPAPTGGTLLWRTGAQTLPAPEGAVLAVALRAVTDAGASPWSDVKYLQSISAPRAGDPPPPLSGRVGDGDLKLPLDPLLAEGGAGGAWTIDAVTPAAGAARARLVVADGETALHVSAAATLAETLIALRYANPEGAALVEVRARVDAVAEPVRDEAVIVEPASGAPLTAAPYDPAAGAGWVDRLPGGYTSAPGAPDGAIRPVVLTHAEAGRFNSGRSVDVTLTAGAAVSIAVLVRPGTAPRWAVRIAPAAGGISERRIDFATPDAAVHDNAGAGAITLAARRRLGQWDVYVFGFTPLASGVHAVFFTTGGVVGAWTLGGAAILPGVAPAAASIDVLANDGQTRVVAVAEAAGAVGAPVALGGAGLAVIEADGRATVEPMAAILARTGRVSLSYDADDGAGGNRGRGELIVAGRDAVLGAIARDDAATVAAGQRAALLPQGFAPAGPGWESNVATPAGVGVAALPPEGGFAPARVVTAAGALDWEGLRALQTLAAGRTVTVEWWWRPGAAASNDLRIVAVDAPGRPRTGFQWSVANFGSPTASHVAAGPVTVVAAPELRGGWRRTVWRFTPATSGRHAFQVGTATAPGDVDVGAVIVTDGIAAAPVTVGVLANDETTRVVAVEGAASAVGVPVRIGASGVAVVDASGAAFLSLNAELAAVGDVARLAYTADDGAGGVPSSATLAVTSVAVAAPPQIAVETHSYPLVEDRVGFAGPQHLVVDAYDSDMAFGRVVDAPAAGTAYQGGKVLTYATRTVRPRGGSFAITDAATNRAAADEPGSWSVTVNGQPRAVETVWRRAHLESTADTGPTIAARVPIRRHVCTLRLAPPALALSDVVVVTPPVGPAFAPVAFREDVRSEMVQIQQTGYDPNQPKIGCVGLWFGVDRTGAAGRSDALLSAGRPWRVVDDATGATALSGALALQRTGAATVPYRSGTLASGYDVYVADFSALTAPGRYRLVVPGIGCSHPFDVRAGAMLAVARHVCRGMFHMRRDQPFLPPRTDYGPEPVGYGDDPLTGAPHRARISRTRLSHIDIDGLAGLNKVHRTVNTTHSLAYVGKGTGAWTKDGQITAAGGFSARVRSVYDAGGGAGVLFLDGVSGAIAGDAAFSGAGSSARASAPLQAGTWSGTLSARYGWRDAGDDDTRSPHCQMAAFMMVLPLLFPRAGALDLNIPESGRPYERSVREFGVERTRRGHAPLPDLVHEALWCVDHFRELQTERDASGRAGSRGGVTLSLYGSLSNWIESGASVYTYAPDAWSSAHLAGAAACASWVIRHVAAAANGGVLHPDDAALAQAYLDCALAAWAYHEAFPETYAGHYTLSGDDDWRAYTPRQMARANLYVATGDTAFRDAYFSTAADRPTADQNLYALCCLWAAHKLGVRSPTAAQIDQIVAKFAAYRDKGAGTGGQEFLGKRLRAENSNSFKFKNGLALTDLASNFLAYAALLWSETGALSAADKTRIRDYVGRDASFALGCNPVNQCIVTGIGHKPPTECTWQEQPALGGRGGALEYQVPPGLWPYGAPPDDGYGFYGSTRDMLRAWAYPRPNAVNDNAFMAPWPWPMRVHTAGSLIPHAEFTASGTIVPGLFALLATDFVLNAP